MNVHKPQTKQEAHEEALTGDLKKQYTVGEQLDLIVLKSPQENNGREAYARHDDVAVFIYPCGLHLYSGTHVRARVSERGDNHLKAASIAVLG